MATKTIKEKRARIKRKIRSRVSGTSERPRLSVYRSNRFLYAQLIDDTKGVTVASAHSLAERKVKKMAAAEIIGKKIAELARGQGVEKIVFDRNGQKYAGRIRVLAEAVRSGGIKF